MYNTLRYVLLFNSWNEFAGMLMVAPLDSSITRATYRGYMWNKKLQKTHKYQPATAFTSVGREIKSPPGNDLYCFQIHGQIYQLVSQLYPNKANKP
jgi:hypothetical protein